MRPGYRHHVGPIALARPAPDDDLNIAHYTNEVFPSWDDTDLSDNSTTFDDFRSGKNASLTEEGNGIFDFYLYRRTGVGRSYDEELESNLVAYWQDGKLVSVECTGFDQPLWKDGEFTDARSTIGAF